MVLILVAVALTGNPGVTGPVPSLTLLLGGFTLLLAALLVWRQGLKPFPHLSACATILVLLSALSCTNSPAPYLSSLSLSSLAGFLGAIISMELGLRTRSQWRNTVTGLVLVAVAASAYGIYLWHVQGEKLALKGTFTNPDCFAVIPLIGIFFALGLCLESSGPARVLHILSVFPLGLALLLTASRSGLLGLAVGYLGFLFILASGQSARWRSTAFRLFLLPLVVALGLVISGSDLPLVERFSRLAEGSDPVSVNSRLDVLQHSYRTLMRSPLLGSGSGCFHLAYQQDRTVLSAGEDYMNVAHNDYIQWMVETGIMGGILWIVLLLAALGKAWRSYRSPAPWVAAEVGALCGVCTYMAFNFACPVPADLIWIGALIGLAGALRSMNRDEVSPNWSPALFPLSLLMAVFGLWSVNWAVGCLTVQRAEREAAEMANMLDWEGAVMRLQTASTRQPTNFNLDLRLARLCKKAFVFSGKPVWLENQEKWLRQAAQNNPRDIPVLLSQIRGLEDRRNYPAAEQVVEAAERIAPYSPHLQRAKARNQILLGHMDKAAAILTSLEKTGLAIDDPALAGLVALLEIKGSKGASFLSKIAAADPNRATLVGLDAARYCAKAKEPAAAARLLKQVLYAAPKNGEAWLELAEARGKLGQLDSQLKILDKLRAAQDWDLEPAVQEKLWQNWSDLQLKKGELDLVVAQLEDYLISHQRQQWPRLIISQVHSRRFQKAEARAALREGLPYDEDGSLRIHLADLCAGQGLTELARSYYKEALRLSPQKSLIEERLKNLKNAPEEDGATDLPDTEGIEK